MEAIITIIGIIAGCLAIKHELIKTVKKIKVILPKPHYKSMGEIRTLNYKRCF